MLITVSGDRLFRDRPLRGKTASAIGGSCSTDYSSHVFGGIITDGQTVCFSQRTNRCIGRAVVSENMIYVFVICHIHPDYGPAMTTEELAAMPLSERITGSLINLIPPVILIVGVLGSIFTGWATPTEAAGVGALFSLILAIFYKQFSWKMLYDSLIDTAKTSAMVFIILFGASAFTGIFMSLDGDQLIATWISSVGIGKWGAFAIMMAIVFFMGMFLDWLGIVMIVFPIFLPIMDMFGFDRLWIVAVTAVMLQTCFMTPPFGFALFYIKGIVPPSVKIQEIYRGVIPFILIIIAVVILVTVFPQVVYFLPNLVAS